MSEQLGMQPPHSIEAEEALLGSILINPDARHDVAFLRAEDFYIVKNGWIYDAMNTVAGNGGGLDYLTVVDELRRCGRIDEVGGSAYLTRLLNNTPSTLYTETYGRIIERTAIRRRMLKAASEIAIAAHDEDIDIQDAIAKADAALFKATQTSDSGGLVTVSSAVQANFDVIETKRRENITGVPTGFSDLDALIGGLQNSDLLIVAGRPGMGKTSFILSLALHMMEKKLGIPALFSLEMSDEQVAQRITAMGKDTTVTVKDQRTPAQMDDGRWRSFTDATKTAAKLVGVLDDTGGMTPEQLRGKARLAVRKHGATMILVDYLQLMKAPQYRTNRTQEVGYITHELKNLAKELRVPVIAAAQLSRAVEMRQEKRPQMSDLRESGDIENDADVIMFLYRDEYYNENSEFKNQVEVIVSKHRHGPTGKVALYFDAPKMRVCNLTRKPIDLSAHDGPGRPRTEREE